MTVDEKQKILVVGMGKSGMAAVGLLTEKGNDVFAYDSRSEESFSSKDLNWLKERNVHLFLGKEPRGVFFDTVVMSPGISPDVPVVESARNSGSEVIGELELAYRFCKGSFVAITGTNGKTTTTALVGEMYRLAGLSYELVGNIGLPVSQKALSVCSETTMVTEVSSFQLETTSQFHPKVAAVLNITPDHLDRHGSMEEYVKSKAKVFANQSEDDFLIYNEDDSYTRSLAEQCKKATVVPFSRFKQLSFGVFVYEGKIVIRTREQKDVYLCRASELLIPGMHNLENALAAAAIGYFSGVPTEAIILALTSFAGVEHRIEFVCEKNGVRYVNDSKGTNPEASIKAIEATEAPILLIAGGYEKNSDFDPFIKSFNGKVKYLLVLGVTAPRIAASAVKSGFPYDRIIFCEDMKECVQKAYLHAVVGDTVLLSPACASWGMYNNFEERGEDFKRIALSLVQ